MAITIIEDLVAGHQYTEDDRTGDTVRVFRVDGLNPSNMIDEDTIRANDGAKKIPQAGDTHPTMGDFIMRRIALQPPGNATTAMRVMAYYVKVRRRLINVVLNGVSQNTTTMKDVNGDPILIGYRAPGDGPSSGGSPSTTKPSDQPPLPPAPKESGWRYNHASVPFLLPDTTLEITYLENVSPWDKITKYRGRLNSKRWQGGDPLTWLCESISANAESPTPTNLSENPPQDGVVTGDAKFNWYVTYRFRYRDNPPAGVGWSSLVLFVDQNTGRTPNDVDFHAGGYLSAYLIGQSQRAIGGRGNGWAVVPLYLSADFDELKLVSAVK